MQEELQSASAGNDALAQELEVERCAHKSAKVIESAPYPKLVALSAWLAHCDEAMDCLVVQLL